MKEYIEREAACAYKPPEKSKRRYSTYNLDDAYENGYDEHIKQVEAIPTADVVEVVRCKDCKYWNPYKSHHYRGHFCDVVTLFVQENEYCAWGKRKGGADGGE